MTTDYGTCSFCKRPAVKGAQSMFTGDTVNSCGGWWCDRNMSKHIIRKMKPFRKMVMKLFDNFPNPLSEEELK